MCQGWTLAEQGFRDGEERIVQLRQGLAACRAAGTDLGRPSIFFWLADAYGQRGYPEEGLSLLTEALAVVNKTQERYYEAELYRLKGSLRCKSFEFRVSRWTQSKVQSPQKLNPNL
jgi:hypothetical protein